MYLISYWITHSPGIIRIQDDSALKIFFSYRHEDEVKNINALYKTELEKMQSEMIALKRENNNLQQQRKGVVSAVSSIFGLEHQVSLLVLIYASNLFIRLISIVRQWTFSDGYWHSEALELNRHSKCQLSYTECFKGW